jgi:anti-anti-sigma factor
MNFTISYTTADEVATVRAGGDLDAGNADSMRICLESAVHDARLVIVDLSKVTFMDCAALGVLVATAAQTRRRGGRLVVADPSTVVRLLLEVFDLYPVLGGRRSVRDEQEGTRPLPDCPPICA